MKEDTVHWFYIGQITFGEDKHLLPDDQFLIKVGISAEPWRRFSNFGPRWVDCAATDSDDCRAINSLERSVKAHTKRYVVPAELLDYVPTPLKHPTELRLMNRQAFDEMLHHIAQYLGHDSFTCWTEPEPGL